ncbi:MAG: PLDc N-terminal domain-containing protein [Spirosoma sp.]|nr:PLDc N-terminal domain-containing protein [Spirosoma sp.]
MEFFFIILITSLLLYFVTLTEIVRSQFKGPNDKLMWALIVVFGNLPGILIYWAVGRNQRI